MLCPPSTNPYLPTVSVRSDTKKGVPGEDAKHFCQNLIEIHRQTLQKLYFHADVKINYYENGNAVGLIG